MFNFLINYPLPGLIIYLIVINLILKGLFYYKRNTQTAAQAMGINLLVIFVILTTIIGTLVISVFILDYYTGLAGFYN